MSRFEKFQSNLLYSDLHVGHVGGDDKSEYSTSFIAGTSKRRPEALSGVCPQQWSTEIGCKSRIRTGCIKKVYSWKIFA